MREGAEMDDDGFAEAIAGLVERHPAFYYRMKLEDSLAQGGEIFVWRYSYGSQPVAKLC